MKVCSVYWSEDTCNTVHTGEEGWSFQLSQSGG